MDDYKDTKEGRIVAAKYADILYLSRPEPSILHPRMSVSNRAKIFSPFAALRGYEEEIAEEKQNPWTKKLISCKQTRQLRKPLKLKQPKGLNSLPYVSAKYYCTPLLRTIISSAYRTAFFSPSKMYFLAKEPHFPPRR